jgi:hypothetical protein
MSIEPTLMEKLLNYGVLGIVVGYFMLVLNNTLKENTAALNDLKQIIQRLCDKLGTSTSQVN